MIYDGGLAANGIFNAGLWVWCLVIGGLILVWLFNWNQEPGKNQYGSHGSAVCADSHPVQGYICRQRGPSMEADSSLSFGAAVELSVAMPLSWLPLISDYTREAEKPFRATAASALVYGLVSCFMYVIGMGAAIYTGANMIYLLSWSRQGLGNRTSHYCAVHRDHHIPGRLFCRCIQRVHHTPV